MRELILAMSMSLDGFVSGPDGDVSWMFGSDQQAIDWKVETTWNASLHIMGSRTFRDMAAFWPTATGPFAPPMNRIAKAVFSKQQPALVQTDATSAAVDDAPAGAAGMQTRQLQPGANSWGEAYLASGDLREEIARLKAHDGRPILAHGGAAFARSLVAHGLVDRYCLLVHPVALGTGSPIFRDLAAPRSLRLVSSRAFPGGSVAHVYCPA